MSRLQIVFPMALALAVASTAPLEAADPAEPVKKEQSLREKFALPTHVQMSPMMVPIRHRYMNTSAITLFLEPVNREDVGRICNNVPRIRDAVLRLLSRDPIPTYANKLQLDGIAERMMPAINVVLDEEKIKGVHLEPGMVNLAGRAGGISRLPFATINGCSGIKEIEEKLAAEKAKAKH